MSQVKRFFDESKGLNLDTISQRDKRAEEVLETSRIKRVWRRISEDKAGELVEDVVMEGEE